MNVEQEIGKIARKLDGKSIELNWKKYTFNIKDNNFLEITDSNSWKILEKTEREQFFKDFDEIALKKFNQEVWKSFNKKLKEILDSGVSVEDFITANQKKTIISKIGSIEWNKIKNLPVSKFIWDQLQSIIDGVKQIPWDLFNDWKNLLNVKEALKEIFEGTSTRRPIGSTLSIWKRIILWTENTSWKFFWWKASFKSVVVLWTWTYIIDEFQEENPFAEWVKWEILDLSSTIASVSSVWLARALLMNYFLDEKWIDISKNIEELID
jgi:hypothetical protein